MANHLYDTGAPQRVIVVNAQPETALVRAQRESLANFDLLMENLVDYLARRAAERPTPPEATRASGPVIDAEFERVTERPARRQLAAPKKTREKK